MLRIKTDHEVGASLIHTIPENVSGIVCNSNLSFFKTNENVDVGFSFKYDKFDVVALSNGDSIKPLVQFRNDVLSSEDYDKITLILPTHIPSNIVRQLSDDFPSAEIIVAEEQSNFNAVLRILNESDRVPFHLIDDRRSVGSSLYNISRDDYQPSYASSYKDVRSSIPLPNYWIDKTLREELERKVERMPDVYKQRLDEELKLIEENNFENIFCVVADYVKYARMTDVEVGAGRGSVSNSLVSYLLNITEIDPIEYNLPFERFLNPERIKMPDIDIDFESKGVDEIKEYLSGMFGKYKVCKIRTFNTLKARASLQLVARKMNIPKSDAAFLSKQIYPNQTLEEAEKRSYSLRNFFDANPDVRTAAFGLENIRYSESIHPAGLIINAHDLRYEIPLTESSDGFLVSELEEKHLAKLGFLKFDILSLSNLDILKALRISTDTNYLEFPLDDQMVYNLFSKGNTTGIFQFESEGMRETLRTIMPNNISELATASALFRPGPRKYIKNYAYNKQRGFRYHYKVDEILKDTFGIIVFQEQFNELISLFTGKNIGEADNIRRFLSKGNEEEVKVFFRKMYEESLEYMPDFNNRNFFFTMLFDMKEYSFPKGHALSYALLSYRLAYYKTHFAPQFVKVMIEYKKDIKKELFDYLKEDGWKLIPPHSLRSEDAFLNDGKFYHLTYKHIKLNDSRSFEEVLNKELIHYDWSFERRLMEYTLKLEIEDLEKLTFAGYFDTDKIKNKYTILELINRFKHLSNNRNLSGEEYEKLGLPSITVHQNDFPRDVLIKKEFDALGFNTEETLIEFLSEDKNVNTVKTLGDKGVYVLFGEITKFRKHVTKKGDDMVFLELTDKSGSIDIVVFSDVLEMCRNKLYGGSFVTVSGYIQERNNTKQMVAKNIN